MTDPQPVAAVILAAGLGTRFGGPKAGAHLGGLTFLDRAAATARDAGLDPVIVVVAEGTAAPRGSQRVVNPDPGRGLSSSLQAGLAAVSTNAAACILLVDQPTVHVETIRAVLSARGRRPIVATSANGRYGPPVIIEPAARSFVAALRGDIGLRDVLVERPDLVEPVPVAAHPADVDTAADLAALEARLGS